MPRKSSMDLEKHTLRLRAGDVERIRERFPNHSTNAIIRRVITNFVEAVDPDTYDEETIAKLEESIADE